MSGGGGPVFDSSCGVFLERSAVTELAANHSKAPYCLACFPCENRPILGYTPQKRFPDFRPYELLLSTIVLKFHANDVVSGE